MEYSDWQQRRILGLLMNRKKAASRRGAMARVAWIASMTWVAFAASGQRGLAADSASSNGGAADDFLDRWFAVSDASKEDQPLWMTPVVTVNPRLEQEVCYDQWWQKRPTCVDTTNYVTG